MMKSSKQDHLTYRQIRSALRNRDPDKGDIIILIKQFTPETVFYEVASGLLESETALSYCDHTGVNLTLYTDNTSNLSAIESGVAKFLQSELCNVFNLNAISVVCSDDIGGVCFNKMLDISNESSDAVADSIGGAGLHREDQSSSKTDPISESA